MSIREMFTEDANRTYALIMVFIFCIIALIIAAWTGGFLGFSQTLLGVIALVGGPIGYFFGTANLTKQSEASTRLFKTMLTSVSEIVIATVSRMMSGEDVSKETREEVDSGAEEKDGQSD